MECPMLLCPFVRLSCRSPNGANTTRTTCSRHVSDILVTFATYEDAARKLLPWNLGFTVQLCRRIVTKKLRTQGRMGNCFNVMGTSPTQRRTVFIIQQRRHCRRRAAPRRGAVRCGTKAMTTTGAVHCSLRTRRARVD